MLCCFHGIIHETNTLIISHYRLSQDAQRKNKRTGLGDIGDFITHRLGIDLHGNEEAEVGEIDTDR